MGGVTGGFSASSMDLRPQLTGMGPFSTLSASSENKQLPSCLVSAESVIHGKLGRKHYKTPYTGPAMVCMCAAKFYSSTSQSATNG